MKMNTAVRLLQLLPAGRPSAITIADLAAKWFSRKPTRSDVRNIQRYMNDLATEGKDEPSLVEVIEENLRRFYLKLSRVAEWFMTEEAALNALLTTQVLGHSLGSIEQIGGKKLVDLAENRIVDASISTQRIRERVRIVPDGFGRLPAAINPDVLKAVIESIVRQKQLNFTYVSSAGAKSMVHARSPQGLVAKDGTLYILATKGLSDKPVPFPLHRMSDPEVDNLALQIQLDFDLDRYISDSNQLSHILREEEAVVELELLVAPNALYHFTERKLSTDQQIGLPRPSDGWITVTATAHFTLLLVPFLLSMGGWIEVVGPQQVRDEMKERVRTMYSRY
jgi:predicted DNA-binding transcriptional regulator YafY